MSEGNDYTPGVWSAATHDFASAKQAYATIIDRSYDDAVQSGVDAADLLPDSLVCTSRGSLTIVFDVTASMEKWPQTMFSKLPYFDHETKEYLGEDTQIAYLAVGDAHGDDYPLQAQPYATGLELKANLEKLIPEGGGLGNGGESYDLAALYCLRNISLPNAVRPILIFIGDENFFDTVLPDHAKRYAKVILPEKLATEQVFKELMQKFSVYLIRKPYGHNSDGDMNSEDKMIHTRWVKLLGAERVSYLPDPNRVVDTIFGILATDTDRIPYFEMEITARQTPDQVKMVMESLKTIHAGHLALPVPPAGGGKSTMHTSTAGTKTKSLLSTEEE